MFVFAVEEAHADVLLRAMHTVALADGEVTAKERSLLDAAARAVGRSAASLTPIEPAELAAAGLSPAESERVVQSMLLMAIMDGAGSPAEATVVEAAARALAVHEPRVHNLRQLAEGHVGLMRWDLTRRGYAKDELIRTFREEGVRGVLHTFGPLLGVGSDARTAQRWIALGELPEGTLGHAYFSFIVGNGLSFPGEDDGIGERGAWHDMLHVVGGYPIDPVGEAEVVAFMAGFRKEDPFFWLFTVALQFQVGLVISPFAPGVPDQIDPARFLRHHLRGARVRKDLSADWNFRADLARPLAEVRAELGVVPIEQVLV